MCVAKLTQFMMYYYASFKHVRLNNSTKTFWKGRPAFYSSHKQLAHVSVNYFPIAELNIYSERTWLTKLTKEFSWPVLRLI